MCDDFETAEDMPLESEVSWNEVTYLVYWKAAVVSEKQPGKLS